MVAGDVFAVGGNRPGSASVFRFGRSGLDARRGCAGRPGRLRFAVDEEEDEVRGAALWLLAGLGVSGCTHYYPVPTSAPVFPTAPAPQPSCRQFTRTVTIDGKDVEAVGYVCQQPDGTWALVS